MQNIYNKLVDLFYKIFLPVVFVILILVIISAIPRALDQMYYENYQLPVEEVSQTVEN